MGSGIWQADARPKDWREWILYLFPNAAPLTALLAKIAKEGTTDPDFNWWSKELPGRRALINDADIATTDAVAGTVVALTIDDGVASVVEARKFVKGTVILNERTDELMLVSADPSSDTIIDVIRGVGGTSATTLNNNDGLSIIGNAYEEGALPPRSRYTEPTKDNNYTQIFRNTLGMTRTARKTQLRYDRQGPYRDAMREALQYHAIEMEHAFIFGGKEETTGPDGQPRRMTAGVKSFISTNNTDFGDSFTEDDWDTNMELLFRYGSQSKLALCGTTAMLALNKMAKTLGTINIEPGQTLWGLEVAEMTSIFGKLMLAAHPLFTGHPVWGEAMLILDFDKLKFRYIDDTVFIPNRQSRGQDARLDEYLTEAGLEVHHEKCHAWWYNVTGFTTS
jgi:hypothetical protein